MEGDVKPPRLASDYYANDGWPALPSYERPPAEHNLQALSTTTASDPQPDGQASSTAAENSLHNGTNQTKKASDPSVGQAPPTQGKTQSEAVNINLQNLAHCGNLNLQGKDAFYGNLIIEAEKETLLREEISLTLAASDPRRQVASSFFLSANPTHNNTKAATPLLTCIKSPAIPVTLEQTPATPESTSAIPVSSTTTPAIPAAATILTSLSSSANPVASHFSATLTSQSTTPAIPDAHTSSSAIPMPSTSPAYPDISASPLAIPVYTLTVSAIPAASSSTFPAIPDTCTPVPAIPVLFSIRASFPQTPTPAPAIPVLTSSSAAIPHPRWSDEVRITSSAKSIHSTPTSSAIPTYSHPNAAIPHSRRSIDAVSDAPATSPSTIYTASIRGSTRLRAQAKPWRPTLASILIGDIPLSPLLSSSSLIPPLGHSLQLHGAARQLLAPAFPEETLGDGQHSCCSCCGQTPHLLLSGIPTYATFKFFPLKGRYEGYQGQYQAQELNVPACHHAAAARKTSRSRSRLDSKLHTFIVQKANLDRG